MKKLTIVTAISTAMMVSGLSLAVLADSDDAASFAAQKNAQVSLVEAVNIAEEATGGIGEEAEFELENGKGVYEVEIAMADGTEIEVMIDSQSGSVLSQELEDDD